MADSETERRDLHAGDWVYAWRLLKEPHPEDFSRSWMIGCVCGSLARRVPEEQIGARRHCGCGQRRPPSRLRRGTRLGSFVLGSKLTSSALYPRGGAVRRLRCDCGLVALALESRLERCRRLFCLVCSQVALDPPEDDDAGEESLAQEHPAGFIPRLCPSAYPEDQGAVPPSPDFDLGAPTGRPEVLPPSPLFPKGGVRLRITCPCQRTMVVLGPALGGGRPVVCPGCGRLLLGADRYLPPDPPPLRPALPGAEPRPTPLFPRERLRLGPTAAFWPLDLYDRVPYGETCAEPLLVTAGLRIGLLMAGPRVMGRPDERHVSCSCGLVGYALSGDLSTGRMRSCPRCQPCPPPGSVTEVPLSSWDRLVRRHRGRVVVWVWAPWGGPDALYRPTVTAWAAERPDVRVLSLSAEEAPELVNRLRAPAAPSLFFYDHSVLHQLLVGLSNPEKLRRMAQAAGYDDIAPPDQDEVLAPGEEESP